MKLGDQHPEISGRVSNYEAGKNATVDRDVRIVLGARRVVQPDYQCNSDWPSPSFWSGHHATFSGWFQLVNDLCGVKRPILTFRTSRLSLKAEAEESSIPHPTETFAQFEQCPFLAQLRHSVFFI